MGKLRTLSLFCALLPTAAGSLAYEVGEVVDNFTLPSLDGNTIRLSDYSGRVILIDFWAPW